MQRIVAQFFAFFIAATPCFAVDLDREIDFNIPAQKLDVALVEFSRQAKLQVITSGADIENLETQGAMGRYTISRALLALLRSSGLSFKAVGDSAVSIARLSSAHGEPRAASFWSRQRLAQSDTSAPSQGEERREATTAENESSAQSQKLIELEEILVTGSRLSGASPVRPAPVEVLDRAQIDKTGFATLGEVLATLPQVSVQVPSTQLNSGGAVRLRGLPIGTTLILINGRRVPLTSIELAFNVFTVDTIPLAMVERVELLTGGSSAVYGADALAGVVNVILKRDVSGIGGSAYHWSVSGQSQSEYSLSGGWNWNGGSLSISGGYYRRDAYQRSESERFADQDYRRFGGRDFRTQSTNPGNVFAVGSGNLPGLNSSFAAVPTGSTGVGLTPGSFAATAGTLNRESSNTSISSPYEAYSAIVSATHTFGSGIEAYVDLLASKGSSESQSSPLTINSTIPAANPFNPFGVNVRVNYHLDVQMYRPVETRFMRPLVGARGPLGARQWSWDVAAWIARDENSLESPAIDSAALAASLNSTDPALALNVFQDGRGGSDELLRSLVAVNRTETEGSNEGITGFIKGPLFTLPAGAAQAVIGVEATNEDIDARVPNQAAIQGDRHTRALFGELRLPLIGSKEGAGYDGRLTAEFGARMDRYSDFGTAVSPQAGVVWQLTDSLALRGAYTESFRAPSLQNLHRLPVSASTPITDPRRGNETRTVPIQFGGNPDLTAESGDTTSIGLVFNSASLPGFEATLGHWSVHIEDFIGSPDAQALVNNEAIFGSRITRNAPSPADLAAGHPGSIARVSIASLNFGTYDLAGVDASFKYRLDFADGYVLTPALSVANIYEYRASIAVGVPQNDRVGRFDDSGYAPRWKGNVRVGLARNAWNVGLTGRYVSRYISRFDSVERELGDFWYLDANAALDLRQLYGGRPNALDGLELSIGAANILDREADFFGNAAGFDGTQYDVRGRSVYGRINYRFK